eukprot:TRINITY_DN7836_c0_g1_i1.p1 TRINITY_DN7836_c0_g1~~TRINITY_DN7836_c0_g1_i1.p1  ORF type:complete len:463 (+),score=14.10 TRINITY_DN7836_c0_g1_i1:64-1452(+)
MGCFLCVKSPLPATTSIDPRLKDTLTIAHAHDKAFLQSPCQELIQGLVRDSMINKTTRVMASNVGSYLQADTGRSERINFLLGLLSICHKNMVKTSYSLSDALHLPPSLPLSERNSERARSPRDVKRGNSVTGCFDEKESTRNDIIEHLKNILNIKKYRRRRFLIVEIQRGQYVADTRGNFLFEKPHVDIKMNFEFKGNKSRTKNSLSSYAPEWFELFEYDITDYVTIEDLGGYGFTITLKYYDRGRRKDITVGQEQLFLLSDISNQKVYTKTITFRDPATDAIYAKELIRETEVSMEELETVVKGGITARNSMSPNSWHRTIDEKRGSLPNFRMLKSNDENDGFVSGASSVYDNRFFVSQKKVRWSFIICGLGGKPAVIYLDEIRFVEQIRVKSFNFTIQLVVLIGDKSQFISTYSIIGKIPLLSNGVVFQEVVQRKLYDTFITKNTLCLLYTSPSPRDQA